MNCFTELWRVKLSDWQRGLVIAVLTGPLGIIYDTVMVWLDTSGWQIKFDGKAIIRAAILGFVAYYGKNFFTGRTGNLLTNSTKSLVSVGQEKPKEGGGV
jgi:hypothetical protein